MQSQQFWKKKWFKDIRELIWPLLDDEEEKEDTSDVEKQNKRNEFKVVVDDTNLNTALDWAKKLSDAEEDRRKGIESKAALFLSTVGIATSLVFASSSIINNKSESSVPVNISAIISFILVIYTIRTVWFSVKTLQRDAYHLISFNDINVKGNEPSYKKHLIKTITDKTRLNYSTINSKVDNLTMAQEYYKRAIIVISIYGLWIIAYLFIFKKNETQIKPSIEILNTKEVKSRQVKDSITLSNNLMKVDTITSKPISEKSPKLDILRFSKK